MWATGFLYIAFTTFRSGPWFPIVSKDFSMFSSYINSFHFGLENVRFLSATHRWHITQFLLFKLLGNNLPPHTYHIPIFSLWVLHINSSLNHSHFLYIQDKYAINMMVSLCTIFKAFIGHLFCSLNTPSYVPHLYRHVVQLMCFNSILSTHWNYTEISF